MTGWEQDKGFVLGDVDRIRQDIREIRDCHKNDTTRILTCLTGIKVELATLRTSFRFHSGVWGALAGMIPVIVFILWKVLA